MKTDTVCHRRQVHNFKFYFHTARAFYHAGGGCLFLGDRSDRMHEIPEIPRIPEMHRIPETPEIPRMHEIPRNPEMHEMHENVGGNEEKWWDWGKMA